MSPKNFVFPLSYSCLKIVANQLIYALSDDEGLNYETVEKYLSDATFRVLQDLLKHILNTENLDAATRFSCLQLLLKENVQVLETGVFPHSYYEKILKVIISGGAGLQQLNLKGVWVHDRPELLEKLLENLKNLKVLVMPHIAGDFILKSAVTRESLSILDIGGDCGFSSEALSELKSTSIRVLEIGSYGKKSLCHPENESCVALANAIENLPNLLVIRTYSFVGEALLDIYKRNENFKTKLLYVHDTQTTTEMCKAIVNLCPHLESIYIDTPQNNVLNMLSDLKSLNSLKLARFNYKELLNYLRRSGSQLQTLKLSNCKDGQLDLSLICLFSPGLVNLDCFKINLTFTIPEYFFMSLESLDILYCDVTDLVVKYLLTNSPFLKRVVVGDVIRMTDGDLFRLCAECDFLCLEELWFSCARCLTVTSVQLLMGHCPNLRSLGQLSGWDVSSADVDYLRAFILSTNTDLTLLPIAFP
ncbi:hypothetical protein ILUMI_25122 [Ignelater luminosus]|uniref:Uncharacterized protein n=1 Tax=Ignelater luminosus TaxID=2038154 RepID=A0A8K0C5Z7_IGNLU|nr:hypothetical protein ILUMI_25122 [Ignelater luminosus]